MIIMEKQFEWSLIDTSYVFMYHKHGLAEKRMLWLSDDTGVGDKLALGSYLRKHLYLEGRKEGNVLFNDTLNNFF